MTVVLNPYFSNGVQKLKIVSSEPPPKPKRGLVPPELESTDHEQRCLLQLRSKTSGIEKYLYLSFLKDQDPRLFYKLCLAHMQEFTPLIYTPVVGDACLQYSHNYRRPEGLFVSYKDKGRIREILSNWAKPAEARIAVVTDGSRILGLGDLGVNGMPISIGKLSLYVAGAGIRPESTVPICLDLGTNNPKYLDDPLYLGMREKRVPDQEMEEFMDEFMEEMTRAFPKLLIQFEDFHTNSAFKYLERFRKQYTVFNDDIQGTGSVVLGGFLNAANLASEASGQPLTDHRILFFGAGSAGVGVAKYEIVKALQAYRLMLTFSQVMSFFMLQGMTEDEARRQIWLVDSQGLIYDSRGPMAEHKKYFSRDDYEGPPIKNLVDIISYVKPTALLGLSTSPDTFTPEVIQTMSTLNVRPIIFPLSNPSRLSECTFEEAVEYSEGQVLFASGSPFPETEYDGHRLTPGQGNNMYVFPGIGLGSILCRASEITDSMIEASALGLSDSLTHEERAAGLLYPRIERIREISSDVAFAVIREAQKSGVDRQTSLRNLNDAALLLHIKEKMWNP